MLWTYIQKSCIMDSHQVTLQTVYRLKCTQPQALSLEFRRLRQASSKLFLLQLVERSEMEQQQLRALLSGLEGRIAFLSNEVQAAHDATAEYAAT